MKDVLFLCAFVNVLYLAQSVIIIMIIRHRGVTGLLASGSRQPAAFRLFSNARLKEDNDDDDFRFTGEHKDRLTVEWKRINQHAEAGEIQPAKDLFHQIKPLLPTRLYTCGYNMLLKACAKHALIHPTTNNGVQHLNKSINDDDPALTYTIKTSTEVDVAKEIYQEMIGSGIRLNARTFGKLMEVAGNSGDVHTASLWYQAMKKKGFSPNVVVFNILIDACGRRGDVGMAKWWWGEMGPAGVAPTVCSFNALLSAYTRAGDFASAEGCFDEMHRRGVQPDLISFTTMIDIYGKSNEKDAPNKVEHWFRQMLAANLKPDIITYNVLLSAFARQRDVKTVLHYYQRLPENGLTANVNTYNAILLAVSNDGKAMREWFDFMLKEDVKPDVVSLNTVVFERDLFLAFARLGLCICGRILNCSALFPTWVQVVNGLVGSAPIGKYRWVNSLSSTAE